MLYQCGIEEIVYSDISNPKMCTSSAKYLTMASKIIESNKKKIISVEGLKSTEWIIVDFGDIIVNIFKPEAREYYSLEKIWTSELQDEKISYG